MRSIAPKLAAYDQIEENFFVDFNVQVRYDLTHFASKVPFHIRLMEEKHVFYSCDAIKFHHDEAPNSKDIYLFPIQKSTV